MMKTTPPIDPHIWQWGRIFAGVIFLVVIVLVARLTLDAQAFASAGDQAFQQEDWESAMENYLWSIRHHYPGNPYSHHAVKQMTVLLGMSNETDSLTTDEIREEFRAALRSIRSIYQPFGEILEAMETDGQPATPIHHPEKSSDVHSSRYSPANRPYQTTMTRFGQYKHNPMIADMV